MTKDKDSDNATTLLKALQKTILFEKEMMAWLQRDFGTVFLVHNNGGGGGGNNKAAQPSSHQMSTDEYSHSRRSGRSSRV